MAIADDIRELIQAKKTRSRQISERAIGIDCHLPMDALAHRNDTQRVAIRIAVVSQDTNVDGVIFGSYSRIAAGERRMVGMGEKKMESVRNDRLVVRPLEVAAIALA